MPNFQLEITIETYHGAVNVEKTINLRELSVTVETALDHSHAFRMWYPREGTEPIRDPLNEYGADSTPTDKSLLLITKVHCSGVAILINADQKHRLVCFQVFIWLDLNFVLLHVLTPCLLVDPYFAVLVVHNYMRVWGRVLDWMVTASHSQLIQ